MLLLLLLLLIFLSTIFSFTNSVGIVNNRVVYHLTVAYAQNSSTVVLINNQTPGPLIEAELNDILIIHVTNNLPEFEQFVIHFHGLHFRQSPQMDGVAFVTQLPIQSQHSFTYVVRAYPSGTYFYHSHAGLQSVTAFGGIIIHDRRKPWNIPEVSSGPLLFSDLWFSPDRLTQENGILASPFVWQGEPTYLLINGKRDFVLTVDPDKTYLLRLIGSTTLSTVVFGIDDHPMTVVEVDGTLIVPKPNVTSIEITSGQRYAVTIQTKKQADRVYLMQLSIRWRTLVNGSNCTGVLRYSTTTSIPNNLSSLPVPVLSDVNELLAFSYTNPYRTLLNTQQMPQRSPDKEIYFYNIQHRTADGLGMRWYMNNATLDNNRLLNLTRPLLFDIFNGIESNIPTDVTYSISQNQVVDIVLQNTVATNGVCESHPFHLHGHKFWIHSQGSELYSPSAKLTSDSDDPILRDTVLGYANEYNHLTPNRSTANYLKPCGWVKLRFIADNPGLWLFHCHIGSHLFMGMSILFREDTEHLVMNYMSQN